MGGSSDDQGRGVTTDGSGNVYVFGYTFPADTTFPGVSSKFPTTSSAYQASYGGGDTDAFISKFTKSGSLAWSTYLGGNNRDEGYSVTTDGSGNVYVTGFAGSGFPTTSGAYQQSNKGGEDGFLSKFTSSGSLAWSTYLGGNNRDEGYSVTTDGSGNVYVTGETESGDFPTISRAYQESYGGNGDAFLSKFTSSGSLSWSTYLGRSNNDLGLDVAINGSGRVYVTGEAGSGFPTTSRAYDTSFGGGFSDAFLSRFTSSGSLSYSTYLGGNTGDRGYGVTTDGSGNVYLCGDAQYGFPSTSGAYQEAYADSFLSNPWDAFISKLNPPQKPKAGFVADSGCNEDTLQFVNTSSLLGNDTINQYDWNFGDGSSDSGQSVSHAYRSAGTYTVELIVTTAEGLKDTATKNAKVYPNPSASLSVNDRVQCQRDSFQFTDQSTISTGSLAGYEWSFGDGDSSQSQNPVHHYSTADSFTVGLLVTSDQGCEDSISQQVTVNPNPSASFTVNDRVQCLRDSFQFTDQSTISTGSLSSYDWSFGDGASSQRQNPVQRYSSADSFPVSLSVTSDQGCEDSASQLLTVNPTPNSSFTFTKKSGGTVAFEAADSTLSNYQWTFGDSTSSSKAAPDHTYTSNGTYKVDLVTTNSTNCRDTTTKTVSISTVGLEEKPNGPDIPFKAYPNPFSRGVTISYELPAAQSQVTLKVVDEQGKVITRKEQGHQPAGKHTHQLQALQDASPGTYFIRLKFGSDKRQVERVIKLE